MIFDPRLDLGQLCGFEGPAGDRRSRNLSVVIARGIHLFPFRTEQLSPSAPMVLGPQGPGRVGRRRLNLTGRLVFRRPVFRWLRLGPDGVDIPLQGYARKLAQRATFRGTSPPSGLDAA